MYETKDIVQQMKAAAKRRRILLIVTPILFVIAAMVAIHFIEPKYKSSTTILVQKDETLNPLVMYEMAVQIASEDRLESLNEIIYSRSTIGMLIDSLNFGGDVKTEADKQGLNERIQKNIGTVSRASDSFEISYYDTDPVRARDGTKLLTDHFINTKLRLETRRHEETVKFFSNKLQELETIVGNQRDQSVNITSDRMRNFPADAEALQDRLQAIDAKLDEVEWLLIQEEEKMDIVNAYQNESNPNEAIKHLYKLQLSQLQFGKELGELLNQHDNLQQQFTESYPRLRTLSEQITQIADRVPPVIESRMQSLNSQKRDLNRQKGQVIADMQQFFLATQRVNTQQSDFSIYEGLLSEMRVKLEQAKMTRDISQRATEQFIILDDAVVPEKPVSPNKKLIVGLGLLFGMVMGVGASAMAEAMDTTLRDEEDMPTQKPIIAYISNG